MLRWRRQLLLRQRGALPLLLLVADASCFGLQVANLAEVEPNGSSSERVGFGLASVLLEGSPETADEGVQAAPCLAERAGAGGGRVGVAVEGADWGVDFSLTELIQVAEELENMSAAAAGEGEWGAVVLQVLPEGVPVAALLVLVAATGTRRR